MHRRDFFKAAGLAGYTLAVLADPEPAVRHRYASVCDA